MGGGGDADGGSTGEGDATGKGGSTGEGETTGEGGSTGEGDATGKGGTTGEGETTGEGGSTGEAGAMLHRPHVSGQTVLMQLAPSHCPQYWLMVEHGYVFPLLWTKPDGASWHPPSGSAGEGGATQRPHVSGQTVLTQLAPSHCPQYWLMVEHAYVFPLLSVKPAGVSRHPRGGSWTRCTTKSGSM